MFFNIYLVICYSDDNSFQSSLHSTYTDTQVEHSTRKYTQLEKYTQE